MKKLGKRIVAGVLAGVLAVSLGLAPAATVRAEEIPLEDVGEVTTTGDVSGGTVDEAASDLEDGETDMLESDTAIEQEDGADNASAGDMAGETEDKRLPEDGAGAGSAEEEKHGENPEESSTGGDTAGEPEETVTEGEDSDLGQEPAKTAEEEEGTEVTEETDVQPDAAAEPEEVMQTAEAAEQAADTASGTDWMLDANGKLTIRSDAGMENWSRDGRDIYKEEVVSVDVQAGVTSIGEGVFFGCSSLENITLPLSVVSIEHYAFFGCSSLTSIALPAGVTSIGGSAFYDCSSLTSIEIPSGVTDIGGGAFQDCSNLKGITLPNGLTSIGGEMFKDCSSLTSIKLPDDVTSIGDFAFHGCSSLASIEIPLGVASIGADTFSDCSSLTSIKLPSSLTSIESGVFWGCSSLASIKLPDDVTSIRAYAFNGCSSLKSIELPSSVTSIGDSAFNDCSRLERVTFQGTIPPVLEGEDAFRSCKFVTDNMQGIRVPRGIALAYKAAWREWAVYVTDDSLDVSSAAWALDIDGKLTIQSNSGMADWLRAGREKYGEKVVSVEIQAGVTNVPGGSKIGSFSDCKNLTSITLPSSVKSIDGCAFLNCSNLKDVVLPSGVISIGGNAFCGCSSLTGITIPSHVTSIGGNAFRDCSSLVSITLPSNVTSIGESVFYGCGSLSSVTLPPSVTCIGDSAFSGCSSLKSIELPLGVASIGESAFKECSGLKSITFPSSMTSIGASVFRGCSGLTSVIISDSVTSIGREAFKDCSSLTGITLPASVSSIGEFAFDGCSSLTSITIPSGVTSVKSNLLRNCSNLTSITLPSSVASIEGSAFRGCSSLTSMIIPSGVTIIDDNLFRDCSSLTSIDIPSGVTSIGESAFQGCSSLTSITIPFGVVKVWGSAFRDCNSLASITIPSGVTSIGTYAFSGCSSLTSITMMGAKPPTLGATETEKTYVFASCKFVTDNAKGIKVPAEKEETYKTAWAEWADYIVGDGQEADILIASGIDWTLDADGKLMIQSDAGMENWWNVGREKHRKRVAGVEIQTGVTNILGDSFTGSFSGCDYLTSITIPSGVTSIGGRAFLECCNLKDVTIPSGVVSIGYEAFCKCSSLTEIELPSSVTSIGGGVFEGCSSLTSIGLPPTLTSISAGMCKDCSSLTDIELPPSVTSIGSSAFSRCSSLNSIELPPNVTNMGEFVFNGCSSLASMEIPPGVTSIGGCAFWGCSSLASITLPDDVTSIGRSAFYGCRSLLDITIPPGVTSIGDYAFFYCSSLVDIELPSNVASIGGSAFHNCSSLKSVTMQSITPPELGVANKDTGKTLVFFSCKFEIDNTKGIKVPLGTAEAYKVAWTEWADYIEKDIIPADGIDWMIDVDGKLTIRSDAGMEDWRTVGRASYGEYVGSVEIQAGVTSIGDAAFLDCSNLKDITLPSDMTSIGFEAFCNCSSLTDIEIPNGVTSIGQRVFRGCSKLTNIELPSGATSVEGGMFSGCSSLTSIELPDGVTSIGSNAFSDCSSLTSIELPYGVANIGKSAFWGCSNLMGIELPSSVTSIGGGAFSGCSSLRGIELPIGLTSIETWAFKDCSNLTGITIPTSVTSIKEEAFSGCSSLASITLSPVVTSIGERAFRDCNSLENIMIPSSVRSIGEEAFRGCNSLKDVTLPSGVVSIGIGVFCNCNSLTNIELPPSVKYIEATAFIGCTSLTSIELPSGVTGIGEYAFFHCFSLDNVTLQGTTPPVLYAIDSDTERTYVFSGCKFVTDNAKGIKVPSGTADAYKTAWPEWAAYIADDSVPVTGEKEKVEAAKQAVEKVLAQIQVSNATTKENMETAVKDAVKAALEEAGVDSDGITILVEDFAKTDATTNTAGSISASIKITSGTETATVPVNKTIDKLPSTSAGKVETAKAAVENALAGMQVSNVTTKESLETAVKDAVKAALAEAGVDSDGITIAVENFTKTEATTNAAGNISASIKITSGTETATVPVDKTIDKLPVTPAEKVAAAKAVVEASVKDAIEKMLAGTKVTNDNAGETSEKIKGLIPDAVAGALLEAGISADEVAAGEVDIEVKPADADSEGSIKITIPLTSKEGAGQSDSAVIQLPIAKLGGEEDPDQDAEAAKAAQEMVEDALKGITATNKTTQEDILEALQKGLDGKATVEGIEKFEKQDATQDAPGSISLGVKVTVNGKTVMVDTAVSIAKLDRPARKIGMYVRFTDYYDLDGSTPLYKYTGLAVKPAIEVYNNEERLIPGTDYTVGYKNNTKVGTAALTVKGKGNFSGASDVASFRIIHGDIEKDTEHPTEMTVVANTKVAPVIMNGTKKLTAKDYQLAGDGLAGGRYAAATAEGKLNILTVKGTGSYAGSSFEIKVRVIEKSAARKLAVSVDRSFKPVYSGRPIDLSSQIRKTQGGEGAVAVTDAKDGTKILKEGTDFTVQCASSLTDAGTVRFTVTGMGEYTGSVSKSFRISSLKADGSSKFSVAFDESKAYEYKASGTTVDNLVVTYLGETNSAEDDKVLTQGLDYKVTYSNHKKVSGTKDAGLKITFLGNYKGSGAVSRNFKVVTAKLSAANTQVTVPDKVYSRAGRAYKSTPIVAVDGVTVKASNYTVSYAWATGSEAGDDTKYVPDNKARVTIAAGDTWAKVKVTVTPKPTGSYALAEGAALVGEYYVRKADNAVDLSKAKVAFYDKNGTQLKSLEYNGNPFYTPAGNNMGADNAPEDMNAVYVRVTVGGAVVDPSLYDVVWTNAREKGKAMVVIRGKGAETEKGMAVGSKNKPVTIKAMALKGKTLQFLMENAVNAVDSFKSIF